MAMSIKEISDVFTEIGWKHRFSENEEVIISGGGDEDNNLMFITNSDDDGELFNMVGRIMDDDNNQINAKDHKHVNALMAYLLLRNYETKFGTWEFDIENGVISFAVEIPLEDNKLTAKQLERITRVMNSSGEEASNIKHILETGKVKEEMSDAEMIAKLESLIAMMKDNSSSDSSDSDGI